MVNLLKDAITIKNNTNCLYDTNYAFNSTFTTNGDVDGWDIYNRAHLYGCWNGVLFGTASEVDCSISRNHPFLPVSSENYFYIQFIMNLDIPEHKYKLPPTKGKIQWLTNSDDSWDDNKSMEFDLNIESNWQVYSINMAPSQYWANYITNLRIYPFIAGYSEIKFAFKYIRIISDDYFCCLNTQCSYYTNYAHPCPGVGKFGSITAAEAYATYSTVSGVSDTLLVNIDDYGDERVQLGTNLNVSGDRIAKIINDRLSRISIGGYSYSSAEHTFDNKLKITSGNFGMANEDSIYYEGECALFVVASCCLVETSYFTDLGLTLCEPFSRIYVISGNLSDFITLLYDHAYSSAIMSPKEMLLYKGLFSNIIGLRFSRHLNVLSVKANYNTTSSPYCVTDIFSDSPVDIYMIGGISAFYNHYTSYLYDINNDVQLLMGTEIDAFQHPPFYTQVNSSHLTLHLNYGESKFLFFTLGNDSELSCSSYNCVYYSSVIHTVETITDDFIKSFFPYLGFYEPSTVRITGGTAAEALGFTSQSTNVFSERPAIGYAPAAAKRLKYYEILNLLVDNTDEVAYRHDPEASVVEAGRVDFFETNCADSFIKLDSPDYNALIDGRGRILIDLTHPITDCGYINTIKVAGKIYKGYVPTVLIFRRFKDGSFIKMYELNFDAVSETSVYTSVDNTYLISASLLVSKGDVVAFKDFGLMCPFSATTSKPNALLYSVDSIIDLGIKFFPTTLLCVGVIGPSYHAYSDRKQDTTRLSIDMGKRVNVGNISAYSEELGNSFEYNIAACLDVSWECDLYGDNHNHRVSHSNGTSWVVTHDNVAYGIDALSNCKTTVDNGKQGDSVGHVSSGLATYGEHSYFYVNGDSEWLFNTSADNSEFWSPYGATSAYNYKYDPIKLSITFPKDKSADIHKSIIYFKESNNFKEMSLSYYMGPTGETGNSVEFGYFFIPSFNKIVLDGVEWFPPEDGSTYLTVSDYIFPNPMADARLNYINGQSTNQELYAVAYGTKWNTIEHNFDSIDSYGFMLYCSHHESTKIIEIEVYGKFDVVPTLIDNFYVTSSNYGDILDNLSFESDSVNVNKVSANVYNSPRYFDFEISPQSDSLVYAINFDADASELKTLSCESSIQMHEGSGNSMSSPQKVEIENVYDLPLNLIVDVSDNSFITKNTLFWNRLDSEDSLINSEVGAGIVVDKNNGYDIKLYENQVAINSPCYFLTNLIGGKQSWTYKYNEFWLKSNILEANTSLDIANAPDDFLAEVSFDATSAVYWKLDINGFVPHVLYTIKAFKSNERVTVKNIYIQLGQGLDTHMVLSEISEDGLLMPTTLIYDDFSNCVFTDFWQYFVSSNSYLIENSSGMGPVKIIPDDTCYVYKTLDVNVFSFELDASFNFGNFLHEEEITYKLVLVDSDGLDTLWVEFKKAADLIYMGVYITNPDKANEYYTNSTYNKDIQLFYKTVEYFVASKYGNTFNFYIKKKYNMIEVAKLTCVDTGYILFNTSNVTAKFSSCISKLKLSYSNEGTEDFLHEHSVVDVYSGKTFILDIADGWGSSAQGIRSIEFIDEYGSLITVAADDIATESTLDINAEIIYPSDNAFVTGLSKTGTDSSGWCQWQSSKTTRLICRFSEEIRFSSIVVNNYHITGGYPDRGIKNYIIYMSKYDEYLDQLPYGTINSNMFMLSYGELAGHIAADVIDNQRITIADYDGGLLVEGYTSMLSHRVTTAEVSFKALPIWSNQESVMVEIENGMPIDKLILSNDSTSLGEIDVYNSSNTLSEMCLWANNSTVSKVNDDTNVVAYVSGVWGGFVAENHTWSSYGDLPMWYVHDFGAANKENITSIYMTLWDYYSDRLNPNTLHIYGSNDSALSPLDKVKDLLGTATLSNWSTTPVGKIFDLVNYRAYRYYCFVFTDTTGPTEDFWTGIKILDMYGSNFMGNKLPRMYANGSRTTTYTNGNLSSYKTLTATGTITINMVDLTEVQGIKLAIYDYWDWRTISEHFSLYMSINSTDGNDGDWQFLCDFKRLPEDIYKTWYEPIYFDRTYACKWFKFVRDDNTSDWYNVGTYSRITQIAIIATSCSSPLTTSVNTYNDWLAIDLGQIHIVDFVRHYGSKSNKVNLLTKDVQFSLDNKLDPYYVDWNATVESFRWIRIPLLCGDNVDRVIDLLGIYPDTSYAYTNEGKHNCFWTGLGNLLSSYNSSHNVATSATLSGTSYYDDWSYTNCIQGDSCVEGYENCWGFTTPDDGVHVYPTLYMDLTETLYINKFKITHTYSDADTSTWKNISYKIYGKELETSEYSELVVTTGNSDYYREHNLDVPILIRYIKLEIISFVKPTIPLRIKNLYSGEYSYFDGGFVREFEVMLSDSTGIVNSEEHPIVCLDLTEAYAISTHELVLSKTFNSSVDENSWNNSETYFKYSDNYTDLPGNVSFVDSKGLQLFFNYTSELLSQSYFDKTLSVNTAIYLVKGRYVVDWETFGVDNVGSVCLNITGSSTCMLYNELTSSSWADQTSNFVIADDGHFSMSVDATMDAPSTWGVRNILIYKNSSNSKWVLATRNTATDYAWNDKDEDKGVSYLNKIRVYSSDVFRPTENCTWWTSSISALSNEYVNTKTGKSALRIDFPEDGIRDMVLFSEGDHFGWDENWSIKDFLCFWFFISDVDKVNLYNSSFVFGSASESDSIKFTNALHKTKTISSGMGAYVWTFDEVDISSGWNYLRLSFEKNTFVYPDTDSSLGYYDEPLDFRENYFKSFYVGCSGVGDAFTMLVDGLNIERNYLDDDMVNGGKGLCLTWNECVNIPIGGISLQKGTVEMWVSLYSDTAGVDAFGNNASRSIFSITNSNDEVISVVVKSGNWFEVGFGDARNGYTVLNIDPYDYDFSTLGCEKNTPFHLALSWSNDGTATADGSSINFYINNNMMFSSSDTWDVGSTSSSNFVLGGGGTVLSGNNDIDGSAVFSNIKVYDYCKSVFDIVNFDDDGVTKVSNSSLMYLSIDSENFYDVYSGKLPLVIKEVPPGEKVSFYIKVDKTKMHLIDSLSGMLEVEWEVIV